MPKTTTAKKTGTASNQTETAHKPSVQLKSYVIKSLISTGDFSNIQHEITIEASDLSSALLYTDAHVKELHSTYYKCLEKKPEAKKELLKTTTPVLPTSGPTVSSGGVTKDMGKPAEKTDAFIAAEKAVKASRTEPAVAALADQIGASARLSTKEKSDLFIMISSHRESLK